MINKRILLSLLLIASPAARAKDSATFNQINTAIRQRCEEAKKNGAFDLLDCTKECIQAAIEVALSVESHMSQKEASHLLKRTIKKSDKLLALACKSLEEMLAMHHDLHVQEQRLREAFGWSRQEVYRNTAIIMHDTIKEKTEQLWFLGQLMNETDNNLFDAFFRDFLDILELIEIDIENDFILKAPTIQSITGLVCYRYLLLLEKIEEQIVSTR